MLVGWTACTSASAGETSSLPRLIQVFTPAEALTPSKNPELPSHTRSRIVVEATNDQGDSITGQFPLPRLRVRETVGEGRIDFFQTLMLRDPVSERVHRTKGSWWRSSRTVIERRRLFVLVTPLPVE